jgi:MoaA/NifB/PqqE/SkfB family radical SAM enzyme
MSRLEIAVRNAPLILRGAYEYNVASRFGALRPREWLFPVTYRCNARCVMCNIWQGPHNDELSTEEWRPLLDDPFFAGMQSVTLTGGEPTLRPDLPQLAELLAQKLPALRRLTMTTNALQTQRVVEFCEQLTDLCSFHGQSLFIGISLDGIGAVHDEMRNIPGAFDKVSATVAELERLKPRGLRTGVNCTLTSRNLHDAPNVQRWCAQRGLPIDFIVASFAESYYGNTESEAALRFSDAQRQELATFLRGQASQRSLDHPGAYFYADMARMLTQGTARTTPCIFQKDGVILDARGDLQYCMYSRILGNVQGQSANVLYRAPENLAHRQEIIASKCARCTITCFLELALLKDAFRYMRFLRRGKL